MVKPVVLTPIAELDLDTVFAYLLSKWGFEVADNFADRFEKVKYLLGENPGIYPYFNKSRQIQKCVVTKHNVLYFQETDTTIRILTVFDTRQDPDKLDSVL